MDDCTNSLVCYQISLASGGIYSVETKAFYQLPAPWWKDLLVLFVDYSNQREKVISWTYREWKLVVGGPGLGN